MSAPLPDASEAMRAIDIYLKQAYPGEPPPFVRSQLGVFKTWGGEFAKCPIVIADRNDPPRRYFVRLGNAFYPHMKLIFELGPGGERFYYSVDTHDRHISVPPDSPEYAAFAELMRKNQSLAEAIESAWETAGLPTLKAGLHDDLVHHQSAEQSRG